MGMMRRIPGWTGEGMESLMTKYVVNAEETDLMFTFGEYKELVRCAECEYHRNGVNMCDIWHAHTNRDGYCHRGRKYGKGNGNGENQRNDD